MNFLLSFYFTLHADFDEDQFLGTSDLERTLQLITRDELSSDEVSLVSTKVKINVRLSF